MIRETNQQGNVSALGKGSENKVESMIIEAFCEMPRRTKRP